MIKNFQVVNTITPDPACHGTNKPYGVTRYRVQQEIEIDIVELDDDKIVQERFIPQDWIKYVKSLIVKTETTEKE